MVFSHNVLIIRTCIHGNVGSGYWLILKITKLRIQYAIIICNQLTHIHTLILLLYITISILCKLPNIWVTYKFAYSNILMVYVHMCLLCEPCSNQLRLKSQFTVCMYVEQIVFSIGKFPILTSYRFQSLFHIIFHVLHISFHILCKLYTVQREKFEDNKFCWFRGFHYNLED